jgi:hypothetical protein
VQREARAVAVELEPRTALTLDRRDAADRRLAEQVRELVGARSAREFVAREAAPREREPGPLATAGDVQRTSSGGGLAVQQQVVAGRELHGVRDACAAQGSVEFADGQRQFPGIEPACGGRDRVAVVGHEGAEANARGSPAAGRSRGP